LTLRPSLEEHLKVVKEKEEVLKHVIELEGELELVKAEIKRLHDFMKEKAEDLIRGH